MKWFWLLIVILVALAAVFTLAPGRSRTNSGTGPQAAAPSSAVTDTRTTQSVPTPTTPPATPAAAPPSPAVTTATGAAPAGAMPPNSTAPEPETSKSQPATAAPAPSDAKKPAETASKPPEPEAPKATTPQAALPKAATMTPAEQQAAEAAKARMISDALDAALSGDDPLNAAPKASASSSAAPSATSAAGPAAPVDPSAPVKLEPQADGTVLVDGKYVIKGQGTKDQPYRVTWEQLVSAELTYQPRLGRKIIPERLKMLDGKWVTIAGYVAFPIMAQSQDEMLMMLNQWDGCCIGVPPTPYDAIEVKLKTAAKGDERLRVSGEITGILRVDPYLVKDWLVSLYLMDEAVLK